MASDLLSRLQQLRQPEDSILATSTREYTLGEVTGLCESLEQTLANIESPSIILHADNAPCWVVADLVCQRLQLALVPLPGFFSALQIKSVLDQCQARYVLTDNPDALHALIPSDVVPVDTQTGLTLCRVDQAHSEAAVMPEGTGKITFTSGSTGDAKGVCLSTEQQLKQAEVLATMVGLVSPRHCCLLPLGVLLENIAGIYAPLLAGGQVILPTLHELGYQGSRLVSPEKMLGCLQAFQPDSVILIPELLKLLVAACATGWQSPASFKFIAVGGSKVSRTLLEQARALGLPVYEGYGLSECASVVTLNTQGANLDGSCGKVLPHTTLDLIDGEIVVLGNLMLGYLNQPQSWYPYTFKTGDLGWMDEEGFVHLAGRKKNILVSSYGRNISPEWPESELLANPQLADVVVFGDERPWCVALISSRNPDMTDSQIQSWIDRVNAGLPDYAQVRGWYRLPQTLVCLPGLLTANGRPRRSAIARYFAGEIDGLYDPEQILEENAAVNGG